MKDEISNVLATIPTKPELSDKQEAIIQQVKDESYDLLGTIDIHGMVDQLFVTKLEDMKDHLWNVLATVPNISQLSMRS
jgi:hypothetical protein